MYKKLFLFAAFAFMLTSCTVTRTTIGDGPIGKQGITQVHSKGKQLYLFWGLLPLGYTSPPIPADNNCQIKTSRNVGDALITYITFGIVQSRTIKVLVKKEN